MSYQHKMGILQQTSCTFGWLNINCKFMKKVFLGNKKIWEIFLLLSDFIIIGVNGTQTIKFGMDENF